MEKEREENNYAFIDGQNLNLGTIQNNWKVDLYKFREYLKRKYNVSEAYYFLGYVKEEHQELYVRLQKAGFVIIFREHNSNLKTEKKGNVDDEIVFEIMKNVADQTEMRKAVLVSGDGDYKKMVDYLIKKKKFKKILFPNKKFASSLYKDAGSEFFDYLENPSVRSKIEFVHKKRAP
ncbi:MAG: NYN domain-containing protein [Candidatus Parcubacteria bacterium]|nr:NYN domain-containing protein [Candidatus Parcubacteria bacterium]